VSGISHFGQMRPDRSHYASNLNEFAGTSNPPSSRTRPLQKTLGQFTAVASP